MVKERDEEMERWRDERRESWGGEERRERGRVSETNQIKGVENFFFRVAEEERETGR
ncbi:hypothetical protein ACE6H2_012855 [Prunus campanulata]